MSEYVYQEYPRMLYRPGKGKGEIVWDERVDTKIVQSLDEEISARYQGWLRDPSRAVKRAARTRKWFGFVDKYVFKEWKYWLPILAGALLFTLRKLGFSFFQ